MYSSIFWSWNNNIQKDEIEYQIKTLKEQNIQGFFVHARAGLRIPYLENEWFEAFEYAVKCAEKYNVDIWIYDEFGWPSGIANGKIAELGNEYKSKNIYKSDYRIVSNDDNILCAYTKKDDGYTLQEDYSKADLFIYFEYQNMSDILYKYSGKRFTEFVHEKYKERFSKYFGNTIKGVFFDEPCTCISYPECRYAWSDSMIDEYKHEFNKDIKNDLWMLYQQDEINLFKDNYLKIASTLFSNNFLKVVQKWCSENGLLLTGHFCMEESIHTSLRLSGNTMENYKMIDIPGIDFLGRRIASPLLIKQLTSIKDQFGKTDLMCECFACTGWDASFSQLNYTWKQFAINGINFPCLHLTAYSIEGDRKYDYPEFFSYQEPWYERMGDLIKSMRSFTDFMEIGESTSDILLINPILNLRAMEYRSDEARRVSNIFRQTAEELEERQFQFNIGHENLIKEFSKVNGNKFILGKKEYTFIIIPGILSISSYLFDLLIEFENNGGKVLFVDCYPKYVDWKENEKLNIFINKISKYAEYGSLTFPKRKLLRKAIESFGYKRIVKVTDIYDSESVNDIILRTRIKDNNINISILNKSKDSDKELCLRIKGYNGIYEIDTQKSKDVYLPYQKGENEVFVNFNINRNTHKCFVASLNAVPFKKEISNVEVRNLLLEDVSVDENYYVIDYAQKSYDGINYNDNKYVCFDKFDDSINNLYLKYNFFVDDKLENIKLIAETNNCSDIKINSISIINNKIGYDIDKSFNMYDVNSYVKKGKNNIVIIYNNDNLKKINGEYFTQVYLKGDFSVNSSKLFNEHNYIRTSSDFTLLRKKNAVLDELTKQGLYFYRGKAIYNTHFNYSNGKIELKFGKIYGSTVCVYINEKEAFTICDNNINYEITDYLIKGNNKIKFILYSTNRNVFGPFHHVEGSPSMIDATSNIGVKSTADLITYPYLNDGEIFTENYAFVKFGLNDIKVIISKEENDE